MTRHITLHHLDGTVEQRENVSTVAPALLVRPKGVVFASLACHGKPGVMMQLAPGESCFAPLIFAPKEIIHDG